MALECMAMPSIDIGPFCVIIRVSIDPYFAIVALIAAGG